MKWGRQQKQKQEEQHPSSAFSVSQVFPLSWISKLKQMSVKTRAPQPANPKRSSDTARSRPKPRKTSPSSYAEADDRGFRVSSASDHLSFSPAILHRLAGRITEEEADDVTRRHSCAGDEDIRFLEGKNKSRGGRIFESAQYHTAATEPDFPFSSGGSFRSGLGRFESQQKFTEMVSDIRRSRESSRNVDFSLETEKSENDPGRRGSDAPRRRTARDRGTGGGAEDFVFPLRPIQTATVAWGSRSSDRTDESCRQISTSEWTVEDRRGARKRFSGKMKQRNRVRVYSPRTASKMETSRVRATREKKRRKAEEDKRKRRSLESIAVVKFSFDPQKDFRDSMVEMILENGIGRPEELESLLAFYLSLNSDEYHDVIVKVFRQVLFDLNPERFVSESE